MALPDLKRAAGNTVSTTLNGSITDSVLSITVADASGMSSDGGYLVIDPNNSSKEIVYYTAKSGNVLTIPSGGRGLAGTTNVAHNDGATVTDVIVDANVNDLIDSFEAEHDSDGGHKQLDSQIVASGNDVTTTNKVLDMTGWIATSDTWTYASASDPEFTFTISGDKTAQLQAGMVISLTQTTEKFFFITKVEYSAPNTTVTIFGGTDYDLANAAITSPKYALPGVRPIGFPLDPTKWTVEYSDTNQNLIAATANTWAQIPSAQLSVPTGIWYVEYDLAHRADNGGTSANTVIGWVTLSKTTATEDNAKFTSAHRMSSDGGASVTNLYQTITLGKKLVQTLTSATTYYLNTKIASTNAATSAMGARGDYSTTIIRATIAYL